MELGSGLLKYDIFLTVWYEIGAQPCDSVYQCNSIIPSFLMVTTKWQCKLKSNGLREPNTAGSVNMLGIRFIKTPSFGGMKYQNKHDMLTIAYFRAQQSAHTFYYEIQVPSYAAAPIYSKVTWVDGIDRIPSVIWSYSTEPVQRFTVSNISLSNTTEGAKLIRSQSMLTHFHLRTDQTDLEALKLSIKLNVWIIQLRLLSRTTIIRAFHAQNIPVHCAIP